MPYVLKGVPVSDISLDGMKVARDRLPSFERWVPKSGTVSREALRSICTETGLSETQARFYAKKYQVERTAISLAPRKRGARAGSFHLPAEIEHWLKSELRELHISRGVKLSKRKLAQALLSRLEEAGKLDSLTRGSLSIRTLERFIDRIPNSEHLRYAHSSNRSKYAQSFEGRRAERVLDVVQMDHTRGNVILVDEGGTEIGRPWITLLIDIYTRCILGFYVSMESPSIYRCGRAVANAILPKDEALQSLGLTQFPYPMHGIWAQFDHDGESAHKNPRFLMACRMAGVADPDSRDKGPPTYGAHIERLIGTMLGAFRGLDGATGNSVSDRVPPQPDDHSMTFDAFQRWFVLQIIEYHARQHSAIRMAPLMAWRRATKEYWPRYQGDAKHLFRSFLPSVRRQVSPVGIRFQNGLYQSDELSPYITRALIIHYDPYDLNSIFVDADGRFLEVTRRHFRKKPSLVDYQADKALEKEAFSQFWMEEGHAVVQGAQVESRRLIKKSRERTRKEKRLREGFSISDVYDQSTDAPAPQERPWEFDPKGVQRYEIDY